MNEIGGLEVEEAGDWEEMLLKVTSFSPCSELSTEVEAVFSSEGVVLRCFVAYLRYHGVLS